MPSTFFGLEIARRGLMAQRLAMDTAAHNLANANTEGYTRQEAVQAATPPYTIPTKEQTVVPGQLGTGVEVAAIRRIRDELLDVQLRRALGEAGFWEEREDALSRVEAIFPEPSEYGLQQLIGKFFNNWHELNNNPHDLGLKAAVRVAGEELTAAVRQTYRQLTDNEKNLRDLILEKVNEVNTIAEEINNLNREIRTLVRAGAQPNDLFDRRDVLLDRLARIGEVQVERQSDGVVKVSLFGKELVPPDPTAGAHTVTAYDAATGAGKFDHPDDELWLEFSSDPGNRVNITSAANTYSLSGALVGIEGARQKVKDYMQQLNDLADSLIAQVNQAHPYEENPPGTVIRADFFKGTGAENFDLSDLVKNDLNYIDGTRALTVAGLRDDLTMAGGTTTFEGFYRQLVTRIGEDMRGSAERTAGARAVRKQLENLRQAVSGVSVDEELTRLMQYQYAFQASARVVGVLDQLLDTLINRMAS